MSDYELRSRLAALGLEAYASSILELATPSLRIVASRCDQRALALGASRFGGVPDLPPAFEWPSYKGQPQSFIAQLDLRAIPHPEASDLPRSGWLAFFYEVESMKWGFDPDDRGCSRVVWFDGDKSGLQATPPPPGISDWGRFKPSALLVSDFVDLPDPWDLAFEQVHARMEDREREAYAKFLESRIPGKYHHALGHPQLIQNDMRLECELASRGTNVGTPDGYKGSDAFRPSARDWRLLLQVDTDEEAPGWMWGDCGRIYFWIKQQDLAARRFEDTWLILQCY